MNSYPSPSHQRAALPLHKLTIIIFGLLAMVSIIGGIVAIIVDARSETDLKIFGVYLTTGHVGVALIISGLIMTFFTVRTVLRSQRDLAALPSEKYVKSPSTRESKGSKTAKSAVAHESPESIAVDLGYRLYDSLDCFVTRIREAGDSQGGTFRNNGEMFTLSFNYDGQVTRQLAAKLDGVSLWVHYEVRGMILLRRSNDEFPKGGETVYEHMDHAKLSWSDQSELEWKGDRDEFLRLGQILIRAIYRCSAAQVPVQEWMEKLEL